MAEVGFWLQAAPGHEHVDDAHTGRLPERRPHVVLIVLLEKRSVNDAEDVLFVFLPIFRNQSVSNFFKHGRKIHEIKVIFLFQHSVNRANIAVCQLPQVERESPITMTTYNNTMKRIRKTVDLHGATAHVFRHSYLTYMAGEATDLKTLQSIAGHATIDMTMNRYVHAQPEKIKDAGKKMHDLLAG